MKSCYELQRSRFEETVLSCALTATTDQTQMEERMRKSWDDLLKAIWQPCLPSPSTGVNLLPWTVDEAVLCCVRMSCGEAPCLTRTRGTGLCWQQCPWQALRAARHQADQRSRSFPADMPGLRDGRVALPSPLVRVRVLPPHCPTQLPGSNSCLHHFWLLKRYSNKRKRSSGRSMPKPSGSELKQKHCLPGVKRCWLNSSRASSCFASSFMYSWWFPQVPISRIWRDEFQCCYWYCHYCWC